jgi:hypothetical protein
VNQSRPRAPLDAASRVAGAVCLNAADDYVSAAVGDLRRRLWPLPPGGQRPPQRERGEQLQESPGVPSPLSGALRCPLRTTLLMFGILSGTAGAVLIATPAFFFEPPL